MNKTAWQLFISKVASNILPSPLGRAGIAAFQPKQSNSRSFEQSRNLNVDYNESEDDNNSTVRCAKADLRYMIALRLSSDNMQTLADIINNLHSKMEPNQMQQKQGLCAHRIDSDRGRCNQRSNGFCNQQSNGSCNQ